MKPKTGRKFRLPNGFGTITYLGKNRRRPYAAKSSVISYDENGVAKRKVLGYGETYEEAYQILLEYSKYPYSFDVNDVKFEEVFECLMDKKRKAPGGLSHGNENILNGAFKRSSHLHSMRFSDIKAIHLQKLMDELTEKYSYQTLDSTRSLWNQMWNYAMEQDLAEKNYASFVKLNKYDDTVHGVAFTREEIDRMWSCVDTAENIDIVLVMCYSGYRISAYKSMKVDLDSMTFTGGVKTESGRDRVVPIHRRIEPLVRRLLAEKRLFGQKQWDIRKVFLPALSNAGIEVGKKPSIHTPHDTRHTLATLLAKAGVSDPMVKRILGHKIGDITQDVYVHMDIESLRAAIELVD